MIIINIMLGKGQGGIENAFINYCRCLLLKKHTLHLIISPNAAIEPELKQLSGVQLHYLDNKGAWDPFAKWRLKKMVQSIQPDILLAHANRAMSLSKKLQPYVNILAVVHNYNIKQALQFKQMITTTQHLKKTLLLKSVFKAHYAAQKALFPCGPLFTYHGVCSAAVLQNQRSLPQLTQPPRDVFVLPNMIEVPKVLPKSTLNQPLVIGALGRFVKKKGFDHFIQGLALLKNQGVEFKAILAGDGEEEEYLRMLANTNDLTHQLCFTGWVTPQDFFNSIDIFCLPSLHEPFGIVLIEAFAYEKPVVSTATEGPSEIIQDQINGLLVKKANPDELAINLKKLINNELLRQQLAHQAKQTFYKKYATQVVADELENILMATQKTSTLTSFNVSENKGC